MVETAKTLQPSIKIVVRTHNEDEYKFLKQDNLGKVFYGEEELANGMCKFILDQYAR
jgi:CPA2 family monovalent cation:H+ antiporter-2